MFCKKMHLFCTFFTKHLVISEKSSTFAVDFGITEKCS